MILNNMNLTGNINLLKMDMAGIATIRGIKCIVIPIQENDLYVKVGTDLKAEGVYLGINVYERKEVSRYGQTHTIRQSFSKDYRERETKEVLDAKPFIGNMKPFRENNLDTVNAPTTTTQDDDLPF